jgi:hypothetical protein
MYEYFNLIEISFSLVPDTGARLLRREPADRF